MKTVFSMVLAILLALGSFGCDRGVGVGVSLDVETIQPKRVEGHLVYSAKFLCGTIPPSPNPQLPPPDQPLVPGTYLTAINIHNPHHFTVRFNKKALVTNPQDKDRGKVSEQVVDSLRANEGLEVDCRNIKRLIFGPPPQPDFDPSEPFSKGFVVITSAIDTELDVVAVYTLKNVVSK